MQIFLPVYIVNRRCNDVTSYLDPISKLCVPYTNCSMSWCGNGDCTIFSGIRQCRCYNGYYGPYCNLTSNSVTDKLVETANSKNENLGFIALIAVPILGEIVLKSIYLFAIQQTCLKNNEHKIVKEKSILIGSAGH